MVKASFLKGDHIEKPQVTFTPEWPHEFLPKATADHWDPSEK